MLENPQFGSRLSSVSTRRQWFIYIQLHYTYLMSYDTFSPQRSIPCLLNKAPWGGLYTPAAGRVRQANCHHLYNYETIALALVSRDTPLKGRNISAQGDSPGFRNIGEPAL